MIGKRRTPTVRERCHMDNESSEQHYVALGMSLGLTFGTALGIVFGIAVDNMALMTIGIGSGLAIGVAIGVRLQERHGPKD